MAKVPQYYGDARVPIDIEGDPGDPAQVWASQRTRLRAWLRELPADAWEHETRCTEWNVKQLVEHLTAGAQFLGYTLHQGRKGIATELLRDFDTHATVQATAAMFSGLEVATLLDSLDDMDANIAREVEALDDAGWEAVAEAPPGILPAHLVINHFAFDSWVHEYDLMLPRDELPELDAFEAEVTARYLLGLAVAYTGDFSAQLDVRFTDIDVQLGVIGDGTRTRVVAGHAPDGAPIVEGSVLDIIDRTTGREAGPIDGDASALALLDRMGAVLAS